MLFSTLINCCPRIRQTSWSSKIFRATTCVKYQASHLSGKKSQFPHFEKKGVIVPAAHHYCENKKAYVYLKWWLPHSLFSESLLWSSSLLTINGLFLVLLHAFSLASIKHPMFSLNCTTALSSTPCGFQTQSLWRIITETFPSPDA